MGLYFGLGHLSIFKTKGWITTHWTFCAVGIYYSHGWLYKKKAMDLQGMKD